MHSVLETPVFARRASVLLSQDEHIDMISYLSANAHQGDVIQGLRGVRKLRYAPKGRGKRGAFRVIYYVVSENRPILAIYLYAKNEQGDLNAEQRKAFLRLIEAQ